LGVVVGLALAGLRGDRPQASHRIRFVGADIDDQEGVVVAELVRVFGLIVKTDRHLDPNTVQRPTVGLQPAAKAAGDGAQNDVVDGSALPHRLADAFDRRQAGARHRDAPLGRRMPIERRVGRARHQLAAYPTAQIQMLRLACGLEGLRAWRALGLRLHRQRFPENFRAESNDRRAVGQTVVDEHHQSTLARFELDTMDRPERTRAVQPRRHQLRDDL
jgi:hypothetical protein